MVRAQVPRMTLDELFEQKGDVAKAVLEELEKVLHIIDSREVMCRLTLWNSNSPFYDIHGL